jgi:hypothetical protein
MMHIDVNDSEAVILREFLEAELEDLHGEIHHTDDEDYKEKLKQKQALLKKILAAVS